MNSENAGKIQEAKQTVLREMNDFFNLPDEIYYSAELVRLTKPALDVIKAGTDGGNEEYLKLSTQVVANALYNIISEIKAASLDYMVTVLSEAWPVALQLAEFDVDGEFRRTRLEPNMAKLRQMCVMYNIIDAEPAGEPEAAPAEPADVPEEPAAAPEEPAIDKVNYGIEIGSSKSVIARIENGHPVVKKIVQRDIFDLPADILKALKESIADEDVTAAVISVPSQNQAEFAEAAKAVGIKQVEFIDEYKAAILAACNGRVGESGIYLVFDLGLGSLKFTIVSCRNGELMNPTTLVEPYVNGLALDTAIVDSVFIPQLKASYPMENLNVGKIELLRDTLRPYAEQMKIKLSVDEEAAISVAADVMLCKDDDGNDMELSMTVSRQQIFDAVRPMFRQAVNICKEELDKSNISPDSIVKLILTGGVTNSPLLRYMLREYISQNVDTHINPLTAMAEGAALHADTVSRHH